VGLVAVLLILALVFGGVGLFLTAAKWALIVALVLLAAGLVSGFLARGRTRV
jgi:hypothetical protein